MMINFEATVYAGDTLKIPINGLGDLAGVKKIYFSVKRYKSEADNRSILHIEATEGLLYLNAGVAGEPLHGNITTINAGTGDVLVYLHASESVLIAGATYYCDIKVIEADDSVETRMQGELTFEYSITKAVA